MGYKEFQEIISGGTPSVRGTPPGDFAREGLEESGFIDKLMAGLDYFSRPGRMISEAVGEFSEGPEGDVLGGAWRGLTGEYEHGTLGEQFIPKSIGSDSDPVEEFFKGAARLGVDIATDPVTWAFTPVGRPIVAGVIKGVSKVAGTVGKKLPAGYIQALDRLVLPITTTLRRVSARAPGKGGSANRLAEGIEKMYVGQRTKTAFPEDALRKTLKEQGLNKSWGKGAKEAESIRMQALDHIQTGDFRLGYAHDDSRIQAVAQTWSDQMAMMRNDAINYKDAFGEKFKTMYPGLQAVQKAIRKLFYKKNLMGKDKEEMREQMWKALLAGDETFRGSGEVAGKAYRQMKNKLDKFENARYAEGASVFVNPKNNKGFYAHDFKPLKDYVPQKLSEKGMKELNPEFNPEGFSKFAEQMAKDNHISVPEAKRIIEHMQHPSRAGNIEYARMRNFPEDWLERDPIKLLPVYTERLYGRMAFGKEFGLAGEGFDNLLKDSVAHEGLNASWGSALGDFAKGHTPRDSVFDDVARKVMGFQVMTKMGPLSTLSNATQSINPIVKDGGINFTKGILRTLSEPGQRAGTVAYQRGIHDAFMKIAGGQGTWANRFLTAVGFNTQEKINRFLSANSAIVTAEEMIMKGGKLTDDLIKRGITNKDIISTIENGGKLLDDVADRVALIGSDATQHATHWKDIPLFWQTPSARIALQYKSFVYQQSRFIAREVLGPARKWFLSNGKEGSIGPLARWSVLTGLGGTAVYELRDKIRSGIADLTGEEHEPREWDEENPTWELLQRTMYVGGLGIAGDLAERAARRDLAGWFLGPTVGDLTDVVEGVAAGSKAPEGEIPWDKLWRQITRRTPGLGTLLPYGGEPAGYEKFMKLIGR